MKDAIGKRALDLFGSSLGLIFLLPLFLLAAAAIKIDSRGPIFFNQNRVGRDGRIFKIHKFRTMVDDALNLGQDFATSATDVRITRVGYFLRRYNIDELPQLANVLKGEMSLVGPRPEVPEIVKLYSQNQKKILSVLPGMTDYASLEFRREGELIKQSGDLYKDYVSKILPKKLELQLKYVQEKSFWIDIKLIFKTIGAIIGV